MESVAVRREISAADTHPPKAARLASVDMLRGLVMVIMALDHTRDLFSNATFDPTDLARTTPLLFFTRWITHFCAPVFVLLAGSAAYLSLQRGRERCDLARFLVSRGIWLILLELFVISPLGWSFSLSFAFTRLQVIWVIGVSMVVLGGLVMIWPSRLIGAAGIAMVLLHNLLDGPHAAWPSEALDLIRALHQITFFQPLPHKIVASLYPVIPWVGVMMAGYAMGEVLTLERAKRRRILLWAGTLLTLLFVPVRLSNVYGDPSPWLPQATPLYNLLSFVKCKKYPPSLLYLMMTLGPALLLLTLLDGSESRLGARLKIFGRVPLFYYLLHLPLLHGLTTLFSLARYSRATWMFQDFFALRGSAHPLPPDYGYRLPVVYALWMATVLLLYSACRWFAHIKKTRSSVILRYL